MIVMNVPFLTINKAALFNILKTMQVSLKFFMCLEVLQIRERPWSFYTVISNILYLTHMDNFLNFP